MAALLRHGVDIRATDGRHHFLLPGDRSNIIEHQSYIECFEATGAPVDIVHSVALPVVGAAAWIVDFDSFNHALYVSHFGLSPAYSEESRRATRTLAHEELLELRARNIIGALADTSCHGIVALTDTVLAEIDDAVQRWASPGQQLSILGKTVVALPAVPPIPQTAVEAKWTTRTRMVRLVAAARYSDGKNISAFHEACLALVERHANLEVFLVGAAAPSKTVLHIGGAGGIIHYLEALPRPELLLLLSQAHLVCQPSLAESVGMIAVEAAACGAAVAVCDTPGTAQYVRWFGSDGALFVPGGSSRDWYNVLAHSVDNWSLLSERARTAYSRSVRGPLSWHERVETLKRLYENAAAANRASVLAKSSFAAPAGATWIDMTTRELADAKTAYRHIHDLQLSGQTRTFEAP